jgi:integrase/recombinase XerD
MKQQLQSTNLTALQASYTEWLITKNMSQSVITNYPLGLNEYFYYLEQQHNIRHISKVELEHSEAFKKHLQYRTNLKTGIGCICSQTVNGALKSLNSFNEYIAECSQSYKYAITADYLPISIAEKIVLTQNEVMELYNTTFEPYPFKLSSIEFGQRDRVILAVLYGCGLRKKEAINLDISDVDFINKRLLVRKGKGNKQRFVPIPNQHLQDIKSYIEVSRYYYTERHHDKYSRIKTAKKLNYNKSESALLLSTQGTRLTSFTQRLDYLKNKTSIQKKVTSHVLRHSLGTHLYQRGVKLDNIKNILGHSSIDTTQIYVHISKQFENNNQNDI